MGITVDGTIAGFVEERMFVAAVNLSYFYQSTKHPDAKYVGPAAVTKAVAELNTRESATIPLEAVDEMYHYMTDTYRELERIGESNRIKVLGPSPQRFSSFRDIMNDVGVALGKGKALTLLGKKQFPQGHSADEGEAARLLRHVGLLKPQESLSRLLKGRIVAVDGRQPQGSLVLVHLSNHHHFEGQREIRHNLLGLYERGLALQGLEGTWRETDYTNRETQHIFSMEVQNKTIKYDIDAGQCIEGARTYLASFDEKRIPLFPDHFLECLVGRKILSYGVETPRLYEEAKQLLHQEEKQSQQKGRRRSAREAYEPPQRTGEVHEERGRAMTENLLEIMKERNIRVGSLVIGSGHWEEVKEVLQRRRVNFVMIAVPALSAQ